MTAGPSQVGAPQIAGLVYVQPLGSGGYADVYLYEQQSPRMPVAAKVLRTEGVTDTLRRQFVDEADTMAQLGDHPYIVQVFRAGTSDDDRPYLVMKYYPPPNLASRPRAQRFSVEIKSRRRVRRRTRGNVSSRIVGGWAEVVDTASDLGMTLPRNATRLEQAAGLDALLAPAPESGREAAPSFVPMAGVANHHIFADEPTSEPMVREFWEDVAGPRKVLRSRVPLWRRILADVSPSSAHVTRSTRGSFRRPARVATGEDRA